MEALSPSPESQTDQPLRFVQHRGRLWEERHLADDVRPPAAALPGGSPQLSLCEFGLWRCLARLLRSPRPCSLFFFWGGRGGGGGGGGGGEGGGRGRWGGEVGVDEEVEEGGVGVGGNFKGLGHEYYIPITGSGALTPRYSGTWNISRHAIKGQSSEAGGQLASLKVFEASALKACQRGIGTSPISQEHP